MEGTLRADKIIIVFEHETPDLDLDDYWFWRWSNGHVQLWCLSGVVYDVLKRDECRFMYE